MATPPDPKHDVTIQGDFDFSYQDGHLKLRATDVTIDGLTIPAFSWQWIGLSIAQGILSSFGAAIFGALVNSFLGRGKESLEDELQKMFQEFAELMHDMIQENEIRNATGEVLGYVNNLNIYRNDPTPDGLMRLIESNSVALAKIKTLGPPAYRIFMISSGLQLAALQERIKHKRNKGTIQNFVDQRDSSIGQHKEIITFIDAQTDPATYVKSLPSKIPPEPVFSVRINRNLMGVPVNWKYDLAHTPPPSQWSSLRAQVKGMNTDLGEKMIIRWNSVKL
jgi:hypothetical protein